MTKDTLQYCILPRPYQFEICVKELLQGIQMALQYRVMNRYAPPFAPISKIILFSDVCVYCSAPIALWNDSTIPSVSVLRQATDSNSKKFKTIPFRAAGSNLRTVRPSLISVVKLSRNSHTRSAWQNFKLDLTIFSSQEALPLHFIFRLGAIITLLS